MIAETCENCAWAESCEERKKPGRHKNRRCGFFPNLSDSRNREARKRKQTREE